MLKQVKILFDNRVNLLMVLFRTCVRVRTCLVSYVDMFHESRIRDAALVDLA